MTAYGAVVVAALVMGFALLTTASAAPSTSDQSITLPDNGGTITLKATDNPGSLTPGPDGIFTIVTAPSNGTATIADNGVAATPVMAALATTTTTTAGTLTVPAGDTTDFPSSGFLFIDAGQNVSDALGAFTLDANDEIVSYTGKTSTSFTGVVRGVGPQTDGFAHVAGTVDIYPIAYSTIAVSPVSAGDGSVNLLDASAFQTNGTVVLLGGGGAEANTYTGKTGNALTTLVDAAPPGPANAHVVGESVIQFGLNTDTAVITYTPNTGFTGEDSIVTDYDQVAANRTVSITVIGKAPVANDVEATVTATLPVPLPVILQLGGTDSSETAANSAITFTSLPTKGLLGLTPAPTLTCTDVAGAVIGEVRTNCNASVLYTPLVGATGTDTFTYTISNGAAPDVSAAATVTIILPGGSSTTPGAGFGTALVAGVNLTTYGGGTLAQLATDATAAGATSVSVTSGGSFLVHVVGAPDFVNAAFAANFADGNVPAGTVVLVLVSS